MAGAEVGDHTLEPRENLLVGLGPDQRPTVLLWERQEVFREPWVASLALGVRGAFQRAAAPLHEARQRDDRPPEPHLAGDYLGRLERPAERARVDGVEPLSRQGLPREKGLSSSLLGERKFHLPLPDTAGVRRGLSMTDQEKLLFG